MAIKFVDDEPEGSKKPKKGQESVPPNGPAPAPGRLAEGKPGADELALGDARPEARKRGRKKAPQ